jgi:hypothetical protein
LDIQVFIHLGRTSGQPAEGAAGEETVLEAGTTAELDSTPAGVEYEARVKPGAEETGTSDVVGATMEDGAEVGTSPAVTGQTVVLTAMTEVTIMIDADSAGQLVIAGAQLVMVEVTVLKMVLVVRETSEVGRTAEDEYTAGVLTPGVLTSGVLAPGMLSTGVLAPGMLSTGVLASGVLVYAIGVLTSGVLVYTAEILETLGGLVYTAGVLGNSGVLEGTETMLETTVADDSGVLEYATGVLIDSTVLEAAPGVLDDSGTLE